jgi:hypothetical protein
MKIKTWQTHQTASKFITKYTMPDGYFRLEKLSISTERAPTRGAPARL